MQFLKILLPRALKILETARILSSMMVSSERSWAMEVPRYLNLFVNFTNYFPGMIYLPEIDSSSVSSMGLEWAGKYMASVLDDEFVVFLVHPRCTLSPNQAKLFRQRWFQ